MELGEDIGQDVVRGCSRERDMEEGETALLVSLSC